MDNKALYEEVEMEVIYFDTEDIITTSDPEDGGHEEEFIDEE